MNVNEIIYNKADIDSLATLSPLKLEWLPAAAKWQAEDEDNRALLVVALDGGLPATEVVTTISGNIGKLAISLGRLAHSDDATAATMMKLAFLTAFTIHSLNKGKDESTAGEGEE